MVTVGHWRSCLAAFVIVLAAVLPGVAQARPDLVVTSVSAAPPARERTDNFSIAETVKNAGTTRAAASKVRFFLSRDRAKSARDVRLVGWLERSVPSLRPRAVSKRRTTVTIPAATVKASYYVISCADPGKSVPEASERNNCRASKTRLAVKPAMAPQAGKTSAALIQKALALGAITTERALLYKVFAPFADPRLPSRYRGDDRKVLDTPVLSEVGRRFAGLSSEAKRVARPFLLPAAYRESWYDLRKRGATASKTAAAAGCQPGGAGWSSTGRRHVKVWWDNGLRPGDAALATKIANALENPIWPKLTTLMKRSPPSDATWKTNGCDARFDVYLATDLFSELTGLRAVTGPILMLQDESVSSCNGATFKGATFMAIDPTRTSNIEAIVAHEFMHALQAAYVPCLNLTNLQEATANEAIDYVYPLDNLEHIHAPPFFENPRLLGDFDYPDYVFWFSLGRRGMASAIQRTFAQLATAKTVLQAIDRGLPGGFRTQWPKFALYNWNRVPVDQYTRWDKLAGRARSFGLNGFFSANPDYTTPVSLNGAAKRTLSIDVPQNVLDAQYNHLVFTDSTVRSVVIRNPFVSDPAVSVQGLVKANGSWRVEDWSDTPVKSFCRDRPAENLQELVLIFGYSAYDETVAYPEVTSKLDLENSCSPYRYKILDASFQTHASGSQTGDSCSLAEPPLSSTGTRNFTGTVTGQPLPLVSTLKKDQFGNLGGMIEATTRALWSNDVQESCKFVGGDTPIVPCTITTPDYGPEPDGKWKIGFYFDLQPETATLTGRWSIPDPSIGSASGGSDPSGCFGLFVGFGLPPEESADSFPLATFTGTGAKTIAISGQRSFFRELFPGQSQALDYDWSFSITFVRVDENGNPL